MNPITRSVIAEPPSKQKLEIKRKSRRPSTRTDSGVGGRETSLLSTSQTCTFPNNQGWKTNTGQVSVKRAL